jgi:anti-sigma regulatory factor (Ser/Thr protein kinase)
MSVQQWVTTSDVTHVGEVRRAVLAFIGEHGVPHAVLTDLGIAVSEMVTNAMLHGDGADTLTVAVDVGDDAVTVVVRGAGVGMASPADGPATRMGMVIVAALADDVRVGPTDDGSREVSMTFPRGPRRPQASQE